MQVQAKVLSLSAVRELDWIVVGVTLAVTLTIDFQPGLTVNTKVNLKYPKDAFSLLMTRSTSRTDVHNVLTDNSA